MKEKKLLDRAAFLPSHWQYLRHIVLSLPVTGHVSILVDWALKFGLILAAVHQTGRCAFAGDLVTLLFPASPEQRRDLELHERVLLKYASVNQGHTGMKMSEVTESDNNGRFVHFFIPSSSVPTGRAG